MLALIEIAYGQIRLRAEKEQFAVEDAETEEKTLPATEKVQENIRTVDNKQETQDYEFMNAVQKKTEEEGGQEEDAQEEDAAPADAEEDDGYDMQIVFLGDSILDHERDDGIAALISDACNAHVYNLSMGGTTAALEPDSQYNFENWDSRSLLGVVNGILGNIDRSIFDGYKAGEFMELCDFSKTDYFIIEYGINDFLAKIPTSIYMADGGIRDMDEAHTYGGALDTAVSLLHAAFPDAKIILAAPHFCNFFSGETFIGDCYTLDYGYGRLIDYARSCGYVAEQHKEDGVIFFNAIEEGGIDVYNAEECLKDGIHMTARGRREYVECLVPFIKNDFYPEE